MEIKSAVRFSTSILKDNSDITPLKVKPGETIENFKCVELTPTGIKNIKVIDAISATMVENADRGYVRTFNNGNGYYVSFYSDYSNSGYGTLSIYSTNDGIKLTNKIVFYNKYITHLTVVNIAENIYFLAYSDQSDGGKGYCMIVKLINNVYFGGIPYKFNNGRTEYIAADALTPNVLAIMYKDVGSSDKGNCMVLGIEDTTITTVKTEVTISSKVDTVTALYRETENTFTIIYDSKIEGVILKELTYNDSTIVTTFTDSLNTLDIDAYDDIRIKDKLFFLSSINNKVFLYNIDLANDLILNATYLPMLDYATHLSLLKITDTKLLLIFKTLNSPIVNTMFIYMTDSSISTSDIISLTNDDVINLDSVSLTDAKALITYVYTENSVYKTKHIIYEKNALPSNIMGLAIRSESITYHRCAIGGVISGFTDIKISANYYVSDDGRLVEVPQTLKEEAAIGIDYDKILWLKPILK